MSLDIDLNEKVTLSTIDSDEQEATAQMILDLYNFSQSNEEKMSTWELDFIDDLRWRNTEKPFTEKQIEHTERLHTKYLVDEDY